MWRGIIDALPVHWKTKLKGSLDKALDISTRDKCIELSGKLISLSKVKTKMVYSKVVERKFRRPSSQKSIVRKLGNPDIEWSVIYSSVYKITNDSKLRIFQYKILNNCLFLNMKLFQFKKIESPNCAFCKSQIETLEHFFIDCSYSRNYNISIKIG